MTLTKRLLISFFTPCIIAFIVTTIANANEIKDFIKEKCSFQEAIQALREGNPIHRAGEKRSYIKRTVIMQGKEHYQYGYTWGKDDFSTGSFFSVEDVLAKDWVIEKNQEEK